MRIGSAPKASFAASAGRCWPWERSSAASPSSRTRITTPPNSTPFRWKKWKSAKRLTSIWSSPGWRTSPQMRTSRSDLAILEDAHHHTAKLDAVPVEEMEIREEANLDLVKSWMAHLPTDADILILDEIGKNISGAGMDTKVVNRGIQGQYNPWPGPKFERIFVRDLSELTYNSGVGMGLGDVVTDRLVNRVDWEPTWVNSLTANTPSAIRTPIHFPTDREAIERITPTVGKIDLREVTYAWIRNTMELGRFALSEQLRSEIEKNPALEIESTVEFEFDGENNLISPFAPVPEASGTS